jgi:predicted kinase
MQRSRQMVFVSGAPGAGKTSLAVPLAAELGFALVCKDKLKETLHDALGSPAPDLAWSRKFGAAAMELLWALAADAPSVVIEANFRPHDPYQRPKLSALADHPVEVYCQCDPELAARRYNDRASRARSGEAGKIESSLLILTGVGGLVCGHGWSGGYSCSLGEVVDRGLVDAGGFAQGC